MSTAAVLLIRDEADIIEHVLRHTLATVDQAFVADGGSTDGTIEIVQELAAELPIVLSHDTELGWYQSRKCSRLAAQALELGHDWVLPIDADEIWLANDGRRIADFLAGVAPDVKTVRAVLYNHFPSALDLESATNPLERIGWRSREHQPLQFGKVACRLLPGLVILDGNHGAWSPQVGGEIGGLEVRHFSWRSPERYAAKMAHGYRALTATDLPHDIGRHWRDHGDPDADPGYDERVQAHFRQWFFMDDPEADDSLVYDPVSRKLLTRQVRREKAPQKESGSSLPSIASVAGSEHPSD